MYLLSSQFLLPALLASSAHAFNYARSGLSDCLNTKNVPVVLTNDNGWTTEIQSYNLRFAFTPQVVVVPTTQKHVEDAVKCAAQNGAKVNAKSGGHSYGAFSQGGESGHMMIDLKSFQTVKVNADNTATVGAGVRLGNMAKKIYDLKKRAIPHGTCEGVGIGGHALFGGFGLDSRTYGLTVDQITSMKAVTADGKTLTVTPTSQPDLFWALAGAGPSFAVVTEFTMKTVAAPENNVFWSYNMNFPDSVKLAQAIDAISTWGLKSAPKEMGYGFIVGSDGGLTVRGTYIGTKAKLQTILNTLLAKLKPINNNTTPTGSLTEYGWIDLLVLLAGAPLETGADYNKHDNFYAKSIVTKEAAPLSLNALKGFTSYMKNTPTTASYYIITNLYGGPGSQINAKPASTASNSVSSYAHRDSGYVWQLYGGVASGQAWDSKVITFMNGLVKSFGSEVSGLPAYVPYVDPELSPSVAQTKYWGDGVARLKKIKTQWDSKGVFSWKQGF